MPNTFDYASWLSMECLDLLETKRAVSQGFNTDFNKEFTQKFPIGDSAGVPFPQQFTVREGLEYTPQAINRRRTTVEWDEPFGIDFEWDSAEQMLRAPRGQEKVRKEILEPAMSQLAAEIDWRCARYAGRYAANVVGALGTNPTSFDSSSAAARQMLAELGCPATGEKMMIIPPAVNRSLKNASIGYFNPVTDITKQFRTGIVGSGDGFEWYESPSLYRHTAGTWAGAVTVTSTHTGTAAISSIVVTCTTGDTFKDGDKISIANVLPVHPQTRRTFGTAAKQFTIVGDVTGASSSATLTISPSIYGPGSQYQNVDALPLASAALTLWPGTGSPSGKIGQLGLAFHRNAFALLTAELETPKSTSVELVSTSRDPDTGVQVRFIRAWDNRSSKMTNRFDVMIGFGRLYNDACAVAVACG